MVDTTTVGGATEIEGERRTRRKVARQRDGKLWWQEGKGGILVEAKEGEWQEERRKKAITKKAEIGMEYSIPFDPNDPPHNDNKYIPERQRTAQQREAATSSEIELSSRRMLNQRQRAQGVEKTHE